MIRNYLKIALRNIFKNPVYSFINIVGLAVGLGCSLLILLWVNDEITYDRFHQNKETIFQVYANAKGDGGKIFTQRAVPLPLVEAFKSSQSAIEYVTVTDWGGSHLLNVNDNPIMKEGLYASDDFLKIFSFPLIQGNPEMALKDPNSIVITRATAQALFGTEHALGKTVRVDNQVDATVTGIMENLPANSSLQFDCLLPFSSNIEAHNWVKSSLTNWGNYAFQIYVKLQDGADAADVESRVKNIIHENFEQSDMELLFHPVSSWRLWSKFENGKSVGGAIEQVRMFGIIAIFILLIACINFMNLATARSEHRAKEVGIRKSVGSKRKDLILQFLGESIAMVFLAFVISICLTEIALPFYNNLVDKQLSIRFNGMFLAVAGMVVAVTGLVAGSYPAFYLSSFNAAAVLKSKVKTAQKGATPRKVLVVLQFGFSIFLLSATIIFNKQVQYGQDRALGYDRENLVMIENQGEVQKNFKAIKNELQAKGFSVTQANSPITSIFAYMGDITWEGKRDDQRASFATQATAYDYTKTLGIKLIAGRDFSEDFHDSLSMILNQAAVDYMGFDEPLGQTVTWDNRKYTVIGVTENVLMASVYQSIEPMMIIYDPSWFAYAMVRLPKGNVRENLAQAEDIFRKYNPAYPFVYQFADQEFAKKFTRIQLITQVSNVFAVLAIIISCLGLFGLAAFTAEQRTKEIGIRKVMGASAPAVVMLLSKDFARLVVIAFVIASPLTWWLMNQWLQNYPHRINIEWWMMGLAGMVALALTVVIVSSLAWRAANANPAESLRTE